ncbi:leucine-rich repeat domain-containing protein [Anaerolentibacter hominis]|uniref:leucine-rich repeat domain-containing protein n=1 Tax=Anaerolentibacter hominis TaxID=3079009 RepID=UPI0031B8A3C5
MNKNNRWKVLIGCVCLMLCFLLGQGQTVRAASAKKQGGFTYTVSGKTAKVVKYKGKSKKVIVPKKLGGKQVTSVGSGAFADNAYIEKVTLPDSVKTIGDTAFFNCKKLQQVNTPAKLTKIGPYAFTGCKKLKNFKIPAAVTRIEPGVFYDCAALKEIKLSSKTTYIGDYAFAGCRSLGGIKLPAGVTYLGVRAFYDCASLKEVQIPKRITVISDSLFGNCTSLTGVGLPEAVTLIEAGAFASCSALKEIKLPEQLTEIGGDAFYNCTSLTALSLPYGVESIAWRAFYGCAGIEELRLNEGLKQIAATAFNGCSGITEVTLPNSLETIPDFDGCTEISAFQVKPDNSRYLSADGVLYSKDYKSLVRYPAAKKAANYWIPSAVVSIEDNAFGSQRVLKQITIPGQIRELGDGIFYQAVSVEQVSLPAGLKEIPPRMFNGSGLKTAAIPPATEKIGYQAFAFCKNLEEIYIPSSVTDVDYLSEDWDDEIIAPFVGCDRLKRFTVSALNQYYYDKEGVLYEKRSDKMGDKLISYPSAKEDAAYSIPEGITDIGSYAFSRLRNLKTLYFPDSMTGVFSYFYECTDLKVVIHKNVTRFMWEEHTTDWPIFTRCENCLLEAVKGSKAEEYCRRNKIPYQVRDEK